MTGLWKDVLSRIRGRRVLFLGGLNQKIIPGPVLLDLWTSTKKASSDLHSAIREGRPVLPRNLLEGLVFGLDGSWRGSGGVRGLDLGQTPTATVHSSMTKS